MSASTTGSDHRARVLVTAAALARELHDDKNLIVLAVRNPAPGTNLSFAEELRIPGAVDIFLPSELAGVPHGHSGSRPLPEIPDLQRHARRWGITARSRVVVYDHDRCLVAGRAWWVLRWAGVADVRMLDGGFTSWCAAGLTTNRTPGSNPPGDIELSGGHLPVIDGDQAAALARSGVLLDSRIRPNYIGGRVAPGNPARGHIPGAISAPAADNLGDPGTFTDNDTLSTLYAALGADGSKPIGVYCGVGISATHDIAALAMLGLDAALFPGSWSAWASDPTRPVIIGAKPE